MSSQAERLRQIHKEHKSSDRSDKYETRIARQIDKLENEYQARQIFRGSRNINTSTITISPPTIQLGGNSGLQVGGFIPGIQVNSFSPGIQTGGLQVGIQTGLIGGLNHIHITSNPRIIILPNGTYTII